MSGCCSAISRNNGSEGAEKTAKISSRGKAGKVIAVKGGETFVGTNDPALATDGEGPERKVTVNDFFLESETVTVSRFAEFVEATGYITEAEKFGYSAVFAGLLQDEMRVAENVAGTPWWARVHGAIWNAPEGPGSSIEDRMDHPVTQVSWNDAMAFAAWVGGRLPTEAEWEHAARGGNRRRRYPWGDEEPTDEKVFCNIWQGRFPRENTLVDGFFGTAPARSFKPTDDGFYNLCGNVWEWASEPFRVRSLSRQAKMRNEQARKNSDRVLKGGSFLCHKSYCYRYRIAARMGLSPDSASSNTGFRIAYDARPDASRNSGM
ncbi:formylglycine-generating enzyme family protein [Rhizobium sp. LC145]|uniref:formylglycine-generating enzyme family protein n=1 Tax=Rhizobium sp. LC145 TaxID=1120688 RepID=UPI00062A09F5|nr:formylglycine-generating enzyme family protein [Rhizobium sp. LC145]KKX24487.1 sulfatase modifying factor 1 (C-alpha-formyglycine- generating enzyme 1) [Rhizobium sp. LC145]TKT46568.1 formylglycine-generating enzyme family protein [Rhizobiaceae bacterium LC148]